MKKQIIIGLSLLIFGLLQAQENEQYFHLNVGGGINNLSYQLSDGVQKAQTGYTINAAYSYFFTPKWGIQTGIGVQLFGSLGTINLLTTEPKVDQEGDKYDLRTNYGNWQENQNALFFEIPLVAQFKSTLSQKFRLLASAGFKIGIPISTSYKTTGGMIQTTGFYKEWNVELSDLPQYGLSTTSTSFQGNYSLKTTGMAVADLGTLYKLSNKADLYIGAYFNYGLTNVLNPDSKLIYQQDGKYNGILASNQTSIVKPTSLGVKVGIYWQLGHTENNSRKSQHRKLFNKQIQYL